MLRKLRRQLPRVRGVDWPLFHQLLRRHGCLFWQHLRRVLQVLALCRAAVFLFRLRPVVWMLCGHHGGAGRCGVLPGRLRGRRDQHGWLHVQHCGRLRERLLCQLWRLLWKPLL